MSPCSGSAALKQLNPIHKNGSFSFPVDISTETISMNEENSKTSEKHKFDLNLLQRLDLD